MKKLDEFDEASEFAANAKLFEWLSDDEHRAELLDEMKASRPVLRFKSIEGWDGVDPATASDVYLIAGPGVAEALQKHSVQPYQALGGGKFMLSIDERAHHAAQRHFAVRRISYDDATIVRFAERAFEQAAVLPLKQTLFDVPLLAEQTALRFVATLLAFHPKTIFCSRRQCALHTANCASASLVGTSSMTPQFCRRPGRRHPRTWLPSSPSMWPMRAERRLIAAANHAR